MPGLLNNLQKRLTRTLFRVCNGTKIVENQSYPAIKRMILIGKDC
jgi:hypothetical protein